MAVPKPFVLVPYPSHNAEVNRSHHGAQCQHPHLAKVVNPPSELFGKDLGYLWQLQVNHSVQLHLKQGPCYHLLALFADCRCKSPVEFSVTPDNAGFESKPQKVKAHMFWPEWRMFLLVTFAVNDVCFLLFQF